MLKVCVIVGEALGNRKVWQNWNIELNVNFRPFGDP